MRAAWADDALHVSCVCSMVTEVQVSIKELWRAVFVLKKRSSLCRDVHGGT